MSEAFTTVLREEVLVKNAPQKCSYHLYGCIV